MKCRFLKGKIKGWPEVWKRGCHSHHEAFFRENSAFSVYELFIREAGSSWLTLWLLRQNFHPGCKVRAIKPGKGCHAFLEGNSKSQKCRETGNRRHQRQRRLCCFVHKRKWHVPEAELLKASLGKEETTFWEDSHRDQSSCHNFFNVYFFWERERERGAEREGDRGSVLTAESLTRGLNSWNVRSWPEQKYDT